MNNERSGVQVILRENEARERNNGKNYEYNYELQSEQSEYRL